MQRKGDNRRAHKPDKHILNMKARQRILKGGGKTSVYVQELPAQINALRQPERLPAFAEQVKEQGKGQSLDNQLFKVKGVS